LQEVVINKLESVNYLPTLEKSFLWVP